MEAADLSKRLKIEILPVYFLKGQDSFLTDWAVNVFSTLVDPDYADFNLSEFREAGDMKDVVASLSTVPVFSERRVAIVRSCANMDAGGKSRLEAYLKRPAPFSVLVLNDDSVPAGQSRRRESPLADLYAYGDVVKCGEVSFEQFSGWIAAAAKKRGASVSKGAVSLLWDWTAGNMTAALNELYKLAAYADGRRIEEGDVKLLVTPANDFKAYALSKALAQGNNDLALGILRSLLDRGEAPYALLAMISGQYRRMLHAKISPMDNASLAAAEGVPEWSARAARELAASYGAASLKRLTDRLHSLECSFKSGAITDAAALHEAFAVLLRRR